MSRSLYRIVPSLREELKAIVTKELNKKGIYSKYRLDTVWGHLLDVSREELNNDDDIYAWVSTETRNFIFEAWGPNGRINPLFED